MSVSLDPRGSNLVVLVWEQPRRRKAYMEGVRSNGALIAILRGLWACVVYVREQPRPVQSKPRGREKQASDGVKARVQAGALQQGGWALFSAVRSTTTSTLPLCECMQYAPVCTLLPTISNTVCAMGHGCTLLGSAHTAGV